MRMEPLMQQDYLDGKVVGIAKGMVRLEDGGTDYNCTAPAAIAEQLQPHLNGSTVRVFGAATWLRDVNGQWILRTFSIEHFVTLEDSSLAEILKYEEDDCG
jgi:hypothetical protein